MNYSIFHKDVIPEEILSKHPKPALYIGGMLALFCEDFETATGQPYYHDSVDLGEGGWNPDASPEVDGITGQQLQGLVTQMLSWEVTGRQILLPKSMGRWLFENDDRFKPVQEELN